MSLRSNLFLVLWMVSLLCLKRVLGGPDGIPQGPPLGASWATYTETHMNQWLQLHSARTDATVHTSESNFVSPGQTTEHAEANGGGFVYEDHDEHSALKNAVKSSRIPTILSRLGVSFVLLVIAGLIATGVKKLSALKAVYRPEEKERIAVEPKEKQPDGRTLEGPEISVDARTEEIRRRLEEINATSPAAERLASAVGSDASAVLLNNFKEALKDANGLKLKTGDSKTLEHACLNVVEALKNLHQAALGQVEKIRLANKALPEFSALEELDQADPGLLGESDQPAKHLVIPSLVKTYRSVHKKLERLVFRVHEEARQAASGRQFKDERDVAVLVDTAASLELLQEASEARGRACAAAGEVMDDVVSSVRWFYLGRLNGAVRALEENLTGLRLYSSLVKDHEGALDDAGAAKSPKVKEAQKQIDIQLEEANLSLARFRSYAEQTRMSTTLDAVFATAAKAGEAESAAYASLQKCWKTACFLPSPPEDLDSRGKELVENIVKGIYRSFVLESASLSDLTEGVHETTGKLWQGVLVGGMGFLNADLVRSNHKMARKLLSGSGKRLIDASFFLNAAEQTTKLHVAVEAILGISAGFSALEKDKAAAELLQLNSRLLVFLEEDMEHTASEVHHAGAKSSHFSSPSRKRYEELQTEFNTARKRAKEATTILEAATAAAEMRAHALAMQDLFSLNLAENASWV